LRYALGDSEKLCYSSHVRLSRREMEINVLSLLWDTVTPQTAPAGTEIPMMEQEFRVSQDSPEEPRQDNLPEAHQNCVRLSSLLWREVWQKRPAGLAFAAFLFLFGQELAGQTTQVNQAAGPPGGFVYALAIDPLNPSTLYAGTLGGVYKSTNGGERWTAVSVGLTIAHVRVLAIDPAHPDTLYAGTSGGGVFKSTDGAASWDAVNNGISKCTINAPNCSGELPTFIGVSGLVIDPLNTATVYAAIDSTGLFKSSDGGANWTAANNGLPSPIFASVLAIDPANPAILYAGVRGITAGLFKTVDGGANWSPSNNGLPTNTNLSIGALAIDSINPAIVYVGLGSGGLINGVYKTTNGGITWSAGGLLRGPINLLTIDPSQTATLYAVVNVVVKSTDGGNTWYGTGLLNSTAALAIHPNNSTIYAGSRTGASRSIDGGASWTEINSGITNTSVSAVAIDPSNPATIYAAGNGLFKSASTGRSWTRINVGIPDSVSALALDPSNPAVLYAGVGGAGPGDGVYKSIDGGTTWKGLWNGTARGIRSLVVAPSTPAIMFAVTGRGFYRSNDAGLNWTFVNVATQGPFPTPPQVALFDPANSAIAYAGTRLGVFKSTDGGDTWTAINNGLTIADSSDLPVVPGIPAMVIDPVNPSILYAAAAGLAGLVFKSTDGGESWNLTNSGLPDTFIQHLAIDPASPATLYAATGAGVFKTIDGGASWAIANTGLRGNVRELVISSTAIYAVTQNAGVFRSTNGGMSWQPTEANQD
jgi:photosystem II stability/assembly factor-like uncharacterized protein